MSGEEQLFPEYPVFKGLQRPLEVMGFKGRFVYWAAGAVGGALLGFLIMYIAIGFLVGALTAVISLATGAALIFIKQHKGLHSKLDDKGIFIYAFTRRFMYISK